MNDDIRQRLEALKQHIADLSREDRERQLAKSKDPQAVFALIRKGDTVAVACAIERGMPKDLADQNGMTMMHHAAAHDTKTIAALLIEEGHGAPLSRDRFGRLPLDVAREAGSTDIANQLERITYLGVFRDEIDGPVLGQTIRAYEKERTLAGPVDSRPPYAREIEFRGHLPRLRQMDRDDRSR